MQLKTYLSAALAVASASAQAMNSTGNLTSLLSSNSNLSTLATLVKSQPSLATTLESLTNVTLFAPSNDALQPLLGALQQEAASMPDLVSSLLEYHVIQGAIYASEISATPTFPHTLLNNTAYSNVTGGQVVEAVLSGMTVEIISGLKSVANVTEANLNFTGGVVHVIDSVLTIPENVSATAVAANLTALAGAVTATNLTDTLDSLSDITVFAPTNEAFQAIASATGNLSLSQLAGILEYHVINGTVAYSSMLMNESIPTLNGNNVTITIEDGAVFVNAARVINPDVLVSGGVVHVIDQVLNPNATAATPVPSATAATPAYSGASSGTAIPFTSGIPSPSSVGSMLATSASAVASGYTPGASGAAGSSSAGGAGGSTSSQAGAAAPTGAIGAAALFGGAVLVANW